MPTGHPVGDGMMGNVSPSQKVPQAAGGQLGNLSLYWISLSLLFHSPFPLLVFGVPNKLFTH